MRALAEILREQAEIVRKAHGEDSDWWKGVVAGLQRAAGLAEAHEAYESGRRGREGWGK